MVSYFWGLIFVSSSIFYRPCIRIVDPRSFINMMASRTAMGQSIRLVSHKAPLLSKAIGQRSLTTSQRSSNLLKSSALIRHSFARLPYQQSFRRAYADTLPTRVRRKSGFFRWTWRFMYLSALGGIGWLSNSIYNLRTPNEQFEPDPSKKTLVILGILCLLEVVCIH